MSVPLRRFLGPLPIASTGLVLFIPTSWAGQSGWNSTGGYRQSKGPKSESAANVVLLGAVAGFSVLPVRRK